MHLTLRGSLHPEKWNKIWSTINPNVHRVPCWSRSLSRLKSSSSQQPQSISLTQANTVKQMVCSEDVFWDQLHFRAQIKLVGQRQRYRRCRWKPNSLSNDSRRLSTQSEVLCDENFNSLQLFSGLGFVSNSERRFGFDTSWMAERYCPKQAKITGFAMLIKYREDFGIVTIRERAGNHKYQVPLWTPWELYSTKAWCYDSPPTNS